MRVLLTILFLNVLLIVTAIAQESYFLQAEVFNLPNYNSSVPNNSFTGIGIDGKTGKVSLANDYGWCEIPYRNGQFNFKSSFIAPTKGYKLKAVASSPDGTYVFDTLSNSIMVGRGSYKISNRINNPTGMAYYKGKVYLADKSTAMIYGLQITNNQAKTVQTFKAHRGICGLASDGNFLYSCDNNNIYKHDSNMNRVATYKLSVSIAGITMSGPREILAVAKNENKIYRFRM